MNINNQRLIDISKPSESVLVTRYQDGLTAKFLNNFSAKVYDANNEFIEEKIYEGEEAKSFEEFVKDISTSGLSSSESDELQLLNEECSIKLTTSRKCYESDI